MIKILVLSDNHGHLNTMDNIIKLEKPDIKINCGDYLLPKSEMIKRFDYFVPGNNDMDTDSLEIKVKIGKYNFLIMHGHTLGTKLFFPKKIFKLLKKEKIDALIHGHLHIPIYHENNNRYIFCPGSTNFPRNAAGATYGLIIINNQKITFKHKQVI